MSSSPVPPRRSRHLRIFLVSLGILITGLAVFVFGVSMEATATARGYVTARGTVEVRSPSAGRVIPDWTDKARSEFPKPGDLLKPGSAPMGIQSLPFAEGTPIPTITPPNDHELWLVTRVHVEPG